MLLDPRIILLRLTVAVLLGAVVGLERERLERAAGLRTHALVSMGAALFMIVSAHGFDEVRQMPGIALDPSRVAAQVVSGIGFLGAGTIILRREVVKGLTTAASIWTVAAIGLATGGGLYGAAAAGTLLALLILAGMKPLEDRLFAWRRSRSLVLSLGSEDGSLEAVWAVVEKSALRIRQMLVRSGGREGHDQLELVLSPASADQLTGLMAELRSVPGVREIVLSERTRPGRRGAPVSEGTEEETEEEMENETNGDPDD